jgi:hypothetical protein
VDVTHLRELSKELLGNKYRLEVAVAIARLEGSPFYAQSLVDDCGLRYPRVQEELKRLAAADMLIEQPPEQGGGSTVYYKAIASVYWQMCVQFHEELNEA